MAALEEVLLQALAATTSAQATVTLNHYKTENPEKLVVALANVLGNQETNGNVRQLAGLLLKNICRNEGREEGLEGLWDRMAAESREYVRIRGLEALASHRKEVCEAAAQAVATVAVLEYTRNRWIDAVPVFANVAGQKDLPHCPFALSTIGYFLEQLPPGALRKPDSDSILSLLFSHISPNSDSPIHLEAVKTLGSTLPFSSFYFQHPQERKLIMSMLLASCKQTDVTVCAAGLENMCEAVMWFYDYLEEYVGEMWIITRQVWDRKREKEVILVMEMWNIVGEIEGSRKESEERVLNISERVAASLCPVIFSCLLQGDSGETEDWTVSKAAGALLVTLAEVVGDVIVDLTLPFITSHLHSDLVPARQAALFSMGSILDGPSDQKLLPLVTQSLDFLIPMAKDSNKQIRHAAMWTLSRICECQIEGVAGERERQLYMLLLERLGGDQPALVCVCLVYLLKHTQEISVDLAGNMFESVLHTVLHTSGDVQIAGFTALQAVIQETPHSSLHCTWLERVLSLLRDILPLHTSESIELSLLSALQIAISKLDSTTFTDTIISNIIETVVAFFRKRSKVTEEGLNILGTVVTTVGKRVLPLLSMYWEFVLVGLSTDVCKAGVICVGDHARSLDTALTPYLTSLVPPLLHILDSPTLPSDLKIQSIASLGDLITATQAAFLPFLPVILPAIWQAANSSLQVADPEADLDLFECLQELREGIIDFFASVIQSDVGKSMENELGNVVTYSGKVISEAYHPSNNTHMAVLGLLGDLAMAFPVSARGLLTSPAIFEYVKGLEKTEDAKLRAVVKWTLRELQAI